MLTNDIPFTDMTGDPSAEEYNALLNKTKRYEEALQWIAGLATYEGTRAIEYAERALGGNRA